MIQCRRVGATWMGWLGLAVAVAAAVDLRAGEPVADAPDDPARSTILRARGWLLDGLAGEGVALRWTGADGTLKAEAIVSARDGILLSPAPIVAEPVGFALGPAGLCLVPGGAGRCELPLPGRGQAAVQIVFARRGGAEPPPDGGRHELTVGLAFHAHRDPDAPPLIVTAELDPAACLAIVTSPQAGVSIDGDVMLVTTPRGRMRIEIATGRILDIRLPGGDTIACDLAGDRWRRWRQAILAAHESNRYSPAAPVVSTTAFLADPATTAAAARMLGVVGRGGDGEPLPPWLVALAAGLSRATASGGLDPLDAALARHLPATDDPAGPGPPPADPATDPRQSPTARAAREARDWLEALCGAEAWPTTLAGLAAAVAGQDAAGTLAGAAAYATSDRHGPLAQLVAASIVPLRPLAATFAVAGQSRLDRSAFRADCEPLIAIAADLGLDRAAVAVLRRLDDDEVRVLSAAWLGDEAALLPLVQAVREAPTDAAAAADLAGAVDRWWGESLEGVVAAALARRADLRVGAAATPADTPRR
jgi:hypothetical protein